MDRDSTVDVPLTLHEVAALQLLTTTGENTDANAIASVTAKMETALEEFRKALGTRRFAAFLKSGWRQSAPDDSHEVS